MKWVSSYVRETLLSGPQYVRESNISIATVAQERPGAGVCFYAPTPPCLLFPVKQGS